MKNAFFVAAAVLLAMPSVYAADSPHVIQGIRVGDNKYKVISISNMKCVDAHKQTLPYEPHSEADAMVCTWSSNQPSGKAFIVLNTIAPETLVVKFYAPAVRVGEITADYAPGVTYDKLRAEFNATPFSEVKPGKGQYGEAYWIDGELLTRLACGKTSCSITSGSNYAKAKAMTDAHKLIEKAEKAAKAKADELSAGAKPSAR
jgi:hypothetical protein